MSGDIDSRVSDPNDYESDSPGANDNASGMAGTIEAARVLSKYKFENSIVYLGLSGEEQGLYGGQGFAEFAKKNNWEVIGILNNDMIGNIEGVNGVIDNKSFRIFSEPVPANETDRERYMRRFYGGEVDGNSRQLARFIYSSTKKYMPEMKPNMIYRLDRFGRGGHHRPFNDLGFAGVRIMESHENYNRQHQDLRFENGIKYGDVIDGVDFNYVKKLTSVNIINLVLIGSSPPPPKNLAIGGIVEPSVKFKWDKNNDKNIKGYKIYWRETSSPHWQFSRYVGNINKYTLNGIIIDNVLVIFAYFCIFTVVLKIISFDKNLKEREEGCLSIPGYNANVKRPSSIKVTYTDENKKNKTLEANGLLATCIQHEIDHLNGILFIDHISKLKREIILKKAIKEYANN